MANDDEILNYLRSIDAKLGLLNKQLVKFLSVAKGKQTAKRKVLWARTRTEAKELQKQNPNVDVIRVLVAGTPAEAKKLRKENPDATIIMTGVPRGPSSFVPGGAKSRRKSRTRLKVV